MPKKKVAQIKEGKNETLPKKKNNALEESEEKGKEFYWILGTMVVLILVFLVFYSVFQSLKTFEYQGLTFTKEKLGNIQLYHYYFINKAGQAITGKAISTGAPHKVNLYLRNDPRENNVPVEGKISFEKNKFAYISINTTGLTECPLASIGISSLTTFLTASGVSAKGAVPDEEFAKETNMAYATCETHPDNVVILIQEGNETKIVKQEKCYVITIANCEVVPAIEKFQVQTIIDAKAS